METVIQDPFGNDNENHSEEVDRDDFDLVGDDDNDDDEGDGTVTLDALEAEELQTVETNESATILVDEVSEIMAIRRQEMALTGSQDRRGDEFVCRSCFLVLKNVQLADRRNMLCVDCA